MACVCEYQQQNCVSKPVRSTIRICTADDGKWSAPNNDINGSCPAPTSDTTKCGWGKKGHCSLVDQFSTCEFKDTKFGGQHVILFATCGQPSRDHVFRIALSTEMQALSTVVIENPIIQQLMDQRATIANKAGNLSER
eukprot:233290-Amphidinium_carterae.1